MFIPFSFSSSLYTWITCLIICDNSERVWEGVRLRLLYKRIVTLPSFFLCSVTHSQYSVSPCNAYTLRFFVSLIIILILIHHNTKPEQSKQTFSVSLQRNSQVLYCCFPLNNFIVAILFSFSIESTIALFWGLGFIICHLHSIITENVCYVWNIVRNYIDSFTALLGFSADSSTGLLKSLWSWCVQGFI